ncbi:glycosyltransferase [Lactobacillus sp.]|uniref:glycosyltransferase family 8 protein n=1 Tax=Lactobacillus sp. TaxID=1591 RepID=UPI003EFAF043
MKIHISNIHNAALSDRVKLQHKLAEAGHALGMYELGIFSYPVDSDTPEQLSTRLDGLVSSLEHGDRVILQLPTGNGREFEEKLAWRIQTYTGHYPFILVSTEIGKDYLSMLHSSERVLAVKRWLYEDLKKLMGRDASEKLFFHYADETTSELNDRACLTGFLDGLGDLKENKDAIQVCFALHDNDGTYSSRVAVAMLSVMRKTKSPICFHILLDESVDEVNRRRLAQVARENGATIEFHLINNQKIEENVTAFYTKVYSVAAMYRLFIPQILSRKNRVIYLDADVLVNRDITELWKNKLDNNAIGAVVDSGQLAHRYVTTFVRKGFGTRNEYFNSGVLLMNLEKIRKEGDLWNRFIEYAQKDIQSDLVDQDALNYIFHNDVLYLDEKWNVLTKDERSKSQKIRSAIYHFVGDKGINFSNFTEFDRLYLELRQEVPWEKSIVNDMFLRMLSMGDFKVTELQKLITQLSERKKKKIIFYGYGAPSIRTLISVIEIRKGDYYIDENIKDPDAEQYGRPIKPFSSLENEKKGDFIVIVLPDADNGQALKKLDKLGLRRDIDYFVAPTLTTGDQGGYKR